MGGRGCGGEESLLYLRESGRIAEVPVSDVPSCIPRPYVYFDHSWFPMQIPRIKEITHLVPTAPPVPPTSPVLAYIRGGRYGRRTSTNLCVFYGRSLMCVCVCASILSVRRSRRRVVHARSVTLVESYTSSGKTFFFLLALSSLVCRFSTFGPVTLIAGPIDRVDRSGPATDFPYLR